MRGLPFSATKEDVLEFLDGITVVNGEEGIFLIKVIHDPQAKEKKKTRHGFAF